MKTETTLIENKTKDIVLSLLDAINKEDFKKARTYVSDDFKFSGVLGSRNGADAYFKDMEQMKFKYEIKKSFTDGKDACIFYDVTMSGRKIFCCAWYHLKDDKINSLRVVFDPRPVLEASERQQ
jgi:predicted ester cyclase